MEDISNTEHEPAFEGEGVEVLACWPGSSARRAGVQPGDVLTCVNGQEVRNLTQYLAARKLRKDGMDVVLKREREDVELFVPFSHPITEKAAQKMAVRHLRPKDSGDGA